MPRVDSALIKTKRRDSSVEMNVHLLESAADLPAPLGFQLSGIVYLRHNYKQEIFN